MEYKEILQTVFQLVIIPLLTVLTGYAVKWINAKANEIKANINNAYIQKYLTMLDDTITSAVIAINQTYVDALKKENKFDLEAQGKAFKMAYETVALSLTEEAKKYLQEVVGDLNSYIVTKIEEQVKISKKI